MESHQNVEVVLVDHDLTSTTNIHQAHHCDPNHLFHLIQIKITDKDDERVALETKTTTTSGATTITPHPKREDTLRTSIHTGIDDSVNKDVLVANNNNANNPQTSGECEKMDKMPEHLRYGITLQGIRELLYRLPHNALDIANKAINKKNKFRASAPKFPLNNDINGYVNQHFIKELGGNDNLSVCERLIKQEKSVYVGKANVFVICPLSTSIETLLDTLGAYIQQRIDLEENNTYFWVSDYVIRQNDVKTDLERLRECVEGVNRTVLLLDSWNDPESLKRTCCIKEVYHAQKVKAEFDIVMSKEQKDSFEKALLSDFDSITSALSKVDVKKAKCCHDKSRKRILQDLDNDVGLSKCNELVIRQLRDALLSQCDKKLEDMNKEVRRNSAIFLNNLGKLYQVQGNYKQARQLYEEAISTSREIFESKHPYTLAYMNNLGGLHKTEGNYERARPLYEEVLAIRRETFSSKHPSTLISINALGMLHYSQGNYEKARLLYQEVLSGCRETLGSKHPHTLLSINNLGMLHKAQGNYWKARPFFEEALSSSREILGSKHPHTIRFKKNIDLLNQDQQSCTCIN